MVRHLDAATVEPLIDWAGVMRAITDGHRLPEAILDDTVLRRRDDTLLVRSTLIDGLGSLVKTATVFPGNDAIGRPTVNGAVALFSDDTGELDATIDFHLLTKWKTAADSLLAATRLARPDVAEILIVGSGTVAASMIDAYRSVWPGANITVWSRTTDRATDLADRSDVSATDDLEPAVRAADVISTATMATAPIIHGAWLRPGQHLDLIGGYRIDMRETDDECIARSRVFVDSRHTAAEVGDIATPRSTGVLAEVVADFGALADSRFARTGEDEITVFKNAGGAHLDLMVARYFERATARVQSQPEPHTARH